MKKFGFTLVEALITIGIIGAIAALVLPTFIDKFNMHRYKTILKEDYMILSNAHKLIALDGGGEFKDGLEYCARDNNRCIKNAFAKKIKNSKNCDSNATTRNKCFPAQSRVKELNGNAASSHYFNNDSTSGILLPNGSALAFWNDFPNCDVYYRCGWVTIDVNGIKPPNTWGKDIYFFNIKNEKIVPCCSGSNSENCSTNGRGCAYVYLYNN